MFETGTPQKLLKRQLEILDAALPFVRDGQPNAVHDARIATRRVRELLPLLVGNQGGKRARHLHAQFQRLGQGLGRVRDADVRIALLASLERRIPHAAPALVLHRQYAERERLALLKTLIKSMERAHAAHLVNWLMRHHRAPAGWLHMPARAGGWRAVLQRILALRAREAVAAIGHGTGVYFPNRLHAARIAIKKLRYTVEIVDETGIANQSAALSVLKKAQDILGDLHDRQVLLADLGNTPATQDATQLQLVADVVESEARHLHSRYLERRERLFAVCREMTALRIPPAYRATAVLALAALTASSTAFVAYRLLPKVRALSRADVPAVGEDPKIAPRLAQSN